MSLLVVCEWPVLNIYLGDIDKQFRRVSFCQLLSSRLDQYRVSALELVTTLVVLPGFITYKLSNNRPGTLTCNRQRKTPWFSLRIIGAINRDWYCAETHRQGCIGTHAGGQYLRPWLFVGRCIQVVHATASTSSRWVWMLSARRNKMRTFINELFSLDRLCNINHGMATWLSIGAA